MFGPTGLMPFFYKNLYVNEIMYNSFYFESTFKKNCLNKIYLANK